MALPSAVTGDPTSRAAAALDNIAPGVFSIAMNRKAGYLLITDPAIGGGLKESDTVDVAGINVKSVIGGGKAFRVTLRHRLNNTVAWRGGKAPVAANEQDNITYAYVKPKCLDGRITLSLFEKAIINGEEAIVDWVKENTDDIIEAIVEKLNEGFWDDGTGGETANASMDGVRSFIKDAAAQTYGGIAAADLATPTNWDNQRVTTGTAAFATTQAGLALMHQLSTAILKASGRSPTLWFCTDIVYQALPTSLTGALSFNLPMVASGTTVASKKLIDFNIPHYVYNGAPIVLDADCTAEHMFALYTPDIEFRVLKGGNFKFGNWVEGFNIPAMTKLFYMYGNMICRNRKSQGVLTGITG